MKIKQLSAGILILILCAVNETPAGTFPQVGKQPLPLPYTSSGSGGADDVSWLVRDDGVPVYYFPLPDSWDDHYFNVRFAAPDSAKLIQAAFLFDRVPGDTVSTIPDIHVLIWSSAGITPATAPHEPLDSLVVDDSQIRLYPDTTYVYLETLNLYFNYPGMPSQFHVGWEPDQTDTTDGQLAILADDGIPSTNYSIEWWGGTVNAWRTIQQDWGWGVNFMIRAQVEDQTTGVREWLDPVVPQAFDLQGPFPNPFNSQATIVLKLQKPQELQLQIWDPMGRLIQVIAAGVFPDGKSQLIWQPEGLGSGRYLVMVRSGEEMQAVKATLLK